MFSVTKGNLAPRAWEIYLLNTHERILSWLYSGVVGIKVPGNASPPCVVRYRKSPLHATLSITLTPCKSMEGGLAFLSHRLSE